jgi:hypothetical protein
MSGVHAVIKRLAEFERLLPIHKRKWHRLVVKEGEDADARFADLIANGEAKEGDMFIIRRIVSPDREMSVNGAI